ncbi:hypothetical protein ACFZDJ_47940 [Streptomyces sp. NPDC007896]|uniref:hypothetical protein n=1 Tax=unclassified Streptomyces TaxID=2593676 RepID=UPI0036EB1A85
MSPTPIWIERAEPGGVSCNTRNVKVSSIRHKSPIDDWKGDWVSDPDPDRRDYATFPDFADSDGNTWTLQEIGHQ